MFGAGRHTRCLHRTTAAPAAVTTLRQLMVLDFRMDEADADRMEGEEVG